MTAALVRVSAFLLLVAVIAVAACVMTDHALTRGVGQRWSAAAVFTTIENQAMTGRGPCSRLIIAPCPQAVNHDIGSPKYGRPSPQVRVFCQLSNTTGIMAVYGMLHPVGITGYAIQASRFDRVCERDACGRADLTWFQNFVGGMTR